MRILITGGGTGGHIYPALAIANRLREENHEILFMGAEGALDREIITREGFTFRSIPVLPLKRRFSFSILKSLGRIALSVAIITHLPIMGSLLSSGILLP